MHARRSRETEFQRNTKHTINIDPLMRLIHWLSSLPESGKLVKVVYASTGSLYGNRNYYQSEESSLELNSEYCKSKQLGERYLVEQSSHNKWLITISLRLFHLFGKNFEKGLVYEVMKSVIEERPVKLCGKQGMHLTPTMKKRRLTG